MEFIISFIVTVAAGVACHYIIKWLDGDEYSVASLWGLSLPTPKIGIEKPEGLVHLRVFCCRSLWNNYILLPTGIIAYAVFKINMHKT